MHAIPLPAPFRRRLGEAARAQFQEGPGLPAFDFLNPPGEAALVEPDSVSWQVFRNPVALGVGGVAAVILELAEPSVREGVWAHTSFRADPGTRLRRTGLAAMATVYGARSATERMIAGVVRAHQAVAGRLPDGTPYRANDPVLLTWVHATALFGFGQAHHRFVRPMPPGGMDRLFAEGVAAGRLYGAQGMPASEAAWEALLAAMTPRLEPSPVIGEFMEIMRRAPLLPAPLRGAQRLLVRAAVELVPARLRERLGLGPELGLGPLGAGALRALGALADRLPLDEAPPALACRRLGLPADFLQRGAVG